MEDTRVYITEHDLGIIKYVQSSCEFPWEIFVGGEINCGFNVLVQLPNGPEGAHINDIRIWLNNNAKETVFLTYSRWSPTRIGFTNPQEAVAFQLKFGDYLSSLTQ